MSNVLAKLIAEIEAVAAALHRDDDRLDGLAQAVTDEAWYAKNDDASANTLQMAELRRETMVLRRNITRGVDQLRAYLSVPAERK